MPENGDGFIFGAVGTETNALDAIARKINPSPFSPLAVLEGISRTYDHRDGEVRALDDVAITIRAGEHVCFTGPSGSGKSTLLHLLGLLDRPSRGRYRLSGEDVSELSDRDRARRRNRDIGFVFQAFHLVPHLTIAENVELPLVYGGVAREERAARASAALDRVGLAARRGHLPDELSGGEQQRVAIARAVVTAPRMLLADEPTGNLDDRTAGGILDTFREVHRGGTTLVVVTHNPRVAAVAGRVCELEAGRIVHDSCRSVA